MICVPLNMPLDELNKVASENQYTRYPVYDEDMDHITGMVHVKDLFVLSLKHETCPISKIQRKIPFVPETITLDTDEERDIKEIRPNVYEANGTMRLDELAKFFDMPEDSLDVEDVDTIAGLVVKQLERIAKVGDKVDYGCFTFRVLEIDGARITKILLIKHKEQPKVQTEE